MTQTPAELSVHGWHHFAAMYAHAFRLTTPQLYALVDYIRHWDVLRQCCGAQMSKDWRATLQGHDARTPDPAVHSPWYAACEAYNLDVVEAMLVSTEVFRRFGAHGQWIKKLSTHDGDLNGTYCSWANNEIARHNLQFNDNPASVRQRQIIKKLETGGDSWADHVCNRECLQEIREFCVAACLLEGDEH